MSTLGHSGTLTFPFFSSQRSSAEVVVAAEDWSMIGCSVYRRDGRQQTWRRMFFWRALLRLGVAATNALAGEC